MTKYKFTNEIIEEAVRTSYTYADVCRKLGIPPATGSQSHLKKRIVSAGIDTSHFRLQSWSKGKTFPNRRKSAEEILVILPEGSTRTSGDMLRRALVESNVEYKCSKSECPLIDGTWMGESITLHVDHIDGNWLDNRIENLRFLCPNCHSQTETFAGRGINKEVYAQKRAANLFTPTLCNECSKEISKKAYKCKSCANTKINWPSDEELLSLLANSNFLKLSKELGCSDNAIRKRLKLRKLI